MNEATREAFKRWWHSEGSGMVPLAGEDREAHVRRVTEIAWENGAYVESLRDGRAEAREISKSLELLLRAVNAADERNPELELRDSLAAETARVTLAKYGGGS